MKLKVQNKVLTSGKVSPDKSRQSKP